MADGMGEGAPWRDYLVKSPQELVTEEAPQYEVVIERDLRIPMRDGVELVAMLWRPHEEGRYPALVERSPYRLEARTGAAGVYYAARGYIVISIGARGCFGSGGEFSAYTLGAQAGDGFDTIEWVAQQSWCNGDVATICGSASGYTSYQCAVEAPPHLKPLFVREAPLHLSWEMGGAIHIGALGGFAVTMLGHRIDGYSPEEQHHVQLIMRNWHRGTKRLEETAEQKSHFMPVHPSVRRLPLTPSKLFAGVADYYDDWIVAASEQHWPDDADLSAKVAGVRTPICHLGGWFDSFIMDTLAAFDGMSNRASSIAAREGQRLVIGPWVHGPADTHGMPVGLLEFGPNARLDFHAFRRRWYDAHLKQKGSVDNDPVVWIYLVGADRWLGFASWPPAPSRATPWYLGMEALTESAPEGVQEGDSYEYDPRDPVPSLDGGGAMAVGVDQRPVEDRLLKYTSEPLTVPLTVIGPVKVVLFAASSALDTDWIVRLTMVRPDGASVIISGGVLRARFRHAIDKPELLTPNEVACFDIDLLPISMIIPAGCSLRVTVTSSDFPHFDRNLNTGGPIGLERRGKRASNTVYHDAARPSHLLLPVFGESK